MPKRIPRLARSHPAQTIFFVGLAAIAIWSGVITARVYATEARQRAQEAVRTAEIRDNYSDCIRSIPFLTKFNKAVAGAEEWGRIQILNAKQILELIEPTSEIYHQWKLNLRRQQITARDAGGLRIPVPTKQECADRLAQALDN